MATKFTADDVAHISQLANIPTSPEELQKLADGFTTTMSVVEELNVLDISRAKTVHMTGLQNVWREDVVDEERMFSQEAATANAQNVYDGYFVVDQIIDQDE